MVNMCYCLLAVIGKGIQVVVFGKLRVSETQVCQAFKLTGINMLIDGTCIHALAHTTHTFTQYVTMSAERFCFSSN